MDINTEAGLEQAIAEFEAARQRAYDIACETLARAFSQCEEIQQAAREKGSDIYAVRLRQYGSVGMLVLDSVEALHCNGRISTVRPDDDGHDMVPAATALAYVWAAHPVMAGSHRVELSLALGTLTSIY